MQKEKIFFPNLDGLRFFCFLSVFFFHSFHTDFQYIKENELYHFIKKDIFGNGNIGVNFFFVLSGFLISFLLLKEKEINRKIDIPRFWLRRILRIWPLFFFCVFFGFIIFPSIKILFGQIPNETADVRYYLIFLNNFDTISKGLPDASILGVLWSVAIEEQFYLLWPLLFFIIPRNFYPFLFSVLILISLIFRGLNDNYNMHEFHSLSCMSDLVVGAFGAYAVMYFRLDEKIKHLNKSVVFFVYFIFILIFLFRDEFLYSNFYIRIIERLLISIVILFIILEQNYANNSLFKMSSFKQISNLGKITYGLYCLHFIAILVVTNTTKHFNVNNHLWQVIIVESLFSLILSIIIARISYNIFEKPFLDLKEKFSYISK
jgi:peptidoglycan/LPS O-acetylase OafA/YrhL